MSAYEKLAGLIVERGAAPIAGRVEQSGRETYSIAKNAGDKRFLRFIVDRLVQVHGENPDVDYVQTLRKFADAFEPLTALRAPAAPELGGLGEIQVERERQKTAEGWSLDHDATHTAGEMLRAAVIYMHHGTDRAAPVDTLSGVPYGWPWDRKWWKPKDRRCNLVRAGALCLAEKERLQRRGQGVAHVDQKLNLILGHLDALLSTAPALRVDAGEGRVPAGWQLVPSKLTLEMLKAGARGRQNSETASFSEGWDNALAAAPQPPGVSPAPDALAALIPDDPIERRHIYGYSHDPHDQSRDDEARAAIAQVETGKAGAGGDEAMQAEWRKRYRSEVERVNRSRDGEINSPLSGHAPYTPITIRSHTAPSPEPSRHGVEAMRDVQEALQALADGYPVNAVVLDGHLQIENPKFEEDNGKNPFLLLDVPTLIATLAQHQGGGQTSGSA